MFNPNGADNSQLVPERQDCDTNKMINLYLQPFLACPPMQRFM